MPCATCSISLTWGIHPWLNLNLVRRHLPPSQVTHIDQGKAVHTVVTEVVEKLRPDGKPSSKPPPREWYPYLILNLAYLEDCPNRDIMLHSFTSPKVLSTARADLVFVR